MKNECKDCEKRCKGCHANCESYLEYKNHVDTQNKERKKHVAVVCYQVDQMKKNKEIMRKKKNFRRTKT